MTNDPIKVQLTLQFVVIFVAQRKQCNVYSSVARGRGGGGGGPPRAAHMGAAFLEKLKKQDEHK